MTTVESQPKRLVVVVTGATAGVGRAVVRSYAADGAAIGLIARGQVGLQATAREVEAAGGLALPLGCDVSDAAAVEAAAAAVEARYGPIDVWINAAFAGILAPFVDTALADYQRVTNVTYMGQVHGTMAALKRMRPRNHGKIVLVGSALAYRGIPLQAAYCGAKHAIQGFHDSLRCELLHEGSGVSVTMVQLPGVNTPQFEWIRTTLSHRPKPASPPYQPELAASAIRFAARGRRKSVWLGWPTFEAIWGDRLASPWLDRYLAWTGYAGQQDKALLPAGRQDNLYEPVDVDFGAHGRFDATARRHSPLLWFTINRNAVGAALGLLALLAYAHVKKRDQH